MARPIPKHKKISSVCQKLRLDLRSALIVGPSMCVYLQKCHHNLVSITQKHPKLVFRFANSLLKNQKIEWGKQNLKTNPNSLSLRGSHHFWVMSDENRVMGDGNTKIQTAPKTQWLTHPCRPAHRCHNQFTRVIDPSSMWDSPRCHWPTPHENWLISLVSLTHAPLNHARLHLLLAFTTSNFHNEFRSAQFNF